MDASQNAPLAQQIPLYLQYEGTLQGFSGKLKTCFGRRTDADVTREIVRVSQVPKVENSVEGLDESENKGKGARRFLIGERTL